MMSPNVFISAFGVILVSFSVQGANPRVIKDQIATAPSQSNRYEILRTSSNHQRSSYEDYEPIEISRNNNAQKSNQSRLTQHNFQREKKRHSTPIRNAQKVSTTESSRQTKPISFNIRNHNQRAIRQRRPVRVRVRQNNQSKDEPTLDYSKPTFDRSTYRSKSPSSPTSYSFSNSNIYTSNSKQESTNQQKAHHNSHGIWKPNAGRNVYTSSTLRTLSTPATTTKKIVSNKDKDDESNLEVQRMRLLFKRLEDQEKNINPKDIDSNSNTRESRYTTSYSKVSMAVGDEEASPRYVRPPKGTTAPSPTLRPVFSSTEKTTTQNTTSTTSNDNLGLTNSLSIKDVIETSTFQSSESAPQSVNISTQAPITTSTEIIYTTAAPVQTAPQSVNISTQAPITTSTEIIYTTAAPVQIINISTTTIVATTTEASTAYPIKGTTDLGILGNFTVPDIYKNAPVSPARLATLGNFNFAGIGRPQQQKQQFFQPQTPSLQGGASSQGGLSNLFGIGSQSNFGGFGNFGSLFGDSSSQNTGNSAKNYGSNGGSSIDLGSDTSDFGFGNLFGGGLGGLSSLGNTQNLYGGSGAPTSKSSGVGEFDYLSILASLGGLSGLGGLGGGLGSQGGLGGFGGFSGTSGLGQQNSHSPSLSLSSLGLGGTFGQQNQSPSPSSGHNFFSRFPSTNQGGLGGLSNYPSLAGGSNINKGGLSNYPSLAGGLNINKNAGRIPSLTSAAAPSLPTISSISSISNIPSSNGAATSVSGDTVKSIKK